MMAGRSVSVEAAPPGAANVAGDPALHEGLRPEFQPHPLLRGGHRQTLAGVYLPWRKVRYTAERHRVSLPDGDALILHDDKPQTWTPGDRVVLLMHGLAGCYLSPYLIRASHKLSDAGVRTMRLDLRGCGAGWGLARLPYHAGRSDDVHHAIALIERLCPNSPIGIVGYSLSGNIALNYLGDQRHPVSPRVDRAFVVNPPIDLKACVATLDLKANRPYDRHFVKLLNKAVRELHRANPDLNWPASWNNPRRLYDFDDQYTAPLAGYRDAEEYYARCSAAQHVGNITVPTQILTARDDPLVPVATFESLRLPQSVRVHIAPGGGHMGYIAKRGPDPDRRWMDWRIVDGMSESRPTRPVAKRSAIS